MDSPWEKLLEFFCGNRVKYWREKAEKYSNQLNKCMANVDDMNREIQNLREKNRQLGKKLSGYKAPPKPETEGELGLSELSVLVEDQLGEDVRLDMDFHPSDRDYKLVPRSEMERFLDQDQTDLYSYISNWMDCDDFAYRLMGMLSAPGWSELATGIIWGKFNGNHGMNCFVDSKEVFWAIEPQNDEIMRPKKSWDMRVLMM